MSIECVFHGLTAVAELKHFQKIVELNVRIDVFHGLTAVAELKLITVNLLGVAKLLFSTASPPWPN